MTQHILNEIPIGKRKYNKFYIEEKDLWMVWYFIFTGTLPDRCNKQIQ